MSIALYGTGVAEGVAIGRVHVIERNQLDIPEYSIALTEVAAEVRRFHNAVTLARQQLRAVREHIPRTAAVDIAAFIDTHLLMLEDAALTQEPVRIIQERLCNAEWALRLQRDALTAVFDEMNDPYLRTRKDDVIHVVDRVQRILLNQGPLRHEVPDSRLRGYIVLADDLTPSDTALMEHHGIAAFATEYGGPTSHTAILARSLGIPSIVGLRRARNYVKEDELIVVDGSEGVLLVEPDEAILKYYRGRQDQRRRYLAQLGKLRGKPARTLEGVPITLFANVELPGDFAAVDEAGAAGIGLYRTEFLYMNRAEPPEEEELFATYRSMVEAMDGLPVTFRTLDLGADKHLEGNSGRAEANPALGLRAVRLCLKLPSLFKPQLRAIMRASAYGKARLMIPMLSNVEEMRQVLSMIDAIRAQFRNGAVPFDDKMPVGAMIEVPAAALCADAFAKHMDFLSIGTNDLIQYTMAIDRVNQDVNYLYDPLNPAVLRLIVMTIEAGQKSGVPVAMCGEMAGDARFVRLLLALGLREFSVHPRALLEVKRIVNSTAINALRSTARKLLQTQDANGRLALLDKLNADLEADMTA